MKQLRKRIWIDRFQTLLSLRILAYFLLYQVAVWSLVLLERLSYVALTTVLGEVGTRMAFLFALGSVLFVGILFTYDAIVFSHRIVGPLVRFRKTLRAIADGEPVEPIRLRKDDLLQELKDELNAVIEALEAKGAITRKSTNEAVEPVSSAIEEPRAGRCAAPAVR